MIRVHFRVRGWTTNRYGGAMRQVGIGFEDKRRPKRLSFHVTQSTKKAPRAFR